MNFLAIFGFGMAWAYGSPWWVWVVGFLCLMLGTCDCD